MDVEIQVPVKALTGPDRGILKDTREAGQVTELDIGLPHVQGAIIGSPVVAGGCSIGDHQAVMSLGAVIRHGFVVEDGFQIGVRLITQPAHSTANGTGGGQVGAAGSTFTIAVEQQSGTGVGIEGEALLTFGMGFDLSQLLLQGGQAFFHALLGIRLAGEQSQRRHAYDGCQSVKGPGAQDQGRTIRFMGIHYDSLFLLY